MSMVAGRCYFCTDQRKNAMFINGRTHFNTEALYCKKMLLVRHWKKCLPPFLCPKVLPSIAYFRQRFRRARVLIVPRGVAKSSVWASTTTKLRQI